MAEVSVGEQSLKASTSVEKDNKIGLTLITASVEPNNAKPAHRKRKRDFFNQIRAQMEFYFGDANLAKDRYLNKLIEENPYVPLEVFLTFNKMKILTEKVADIVKALSKSQLLELDETRLRVKRKTPVKINYNADDCTLYVEALPPKADHDWLRKTFERFGAVAYVSLPKYAKSRKNKEFAFVEFVEESSVQKAVNAFRDFNGVLCMQTSEPSQLASVQAYITEQSAEQPQQNENTLGKKKRRLKNNSNTTIEDVEPVSKKAKTNETAVNVGDSCADKTVVTGSSSNSAEEIDINDEILADESGTKKKLRKRSKKCQHLKKLKKEAEINSEGSYLELKVLPKRDWKRLRNKYLNLQRQCVGTLKRKARQTTQYVKEAKKVEVVQDGPSPAKRPKRADRQQLHKMNMNFYGASSEECSANNANNNTNLALNRAPLYNFEPGLIVELSFKEPCTNVKVFKNEMRQHATVKYIDVKEGAMQAYLRLESADAAEDMLRKMNAVQQQPQCKLLTGNEETEYWQKIDRDREMKLNKQIKLPQKRGREKIKKLTQQHIRFDEDECPAVGVSIGSSAVI